MTENPKRRFSGECWHQCWQSEKCVQKQHKQQRKLSRWGYAVFYNLVSTKIGNVVVASHSYDSNGNLAKTTYANGDYLEYAYDNYGNISVITGETGKIAEMIYNKQGLVTKAVDYSSGETSCYYYTFDGSLESKYRTSFRI